MSISDLTMGKSHTHQILHKIIRKLLFPVLRRPWKLWSFVQKTILVAQISLYLAYFAVISEPKRLNREGDGPGTLWDSISSTPPQLWVLGVLAALALIWRTSPFALCGCCCKCEPPRWFLFRASFALELPGLALNSYLCFTDAQLYLYSDRFWISSPGLLGTSVVLLVGGIVSTYSFYNQKRPYAGYLLHKMRKRAVKPEPSSDGIELGEWRVNSKDPLLMVYEAQCQLAEEGEDQDMNDEADDQEHSHSELSDSASDSEDDAFPSSGTRAPDAPLMHPGNSKAKSRPCPDSRTLNRSTTIRESSAAGAAAEAAAAASPSIVRRASTFGWLSHRTNTQPIDDGEGQHVEPRQSLLKHVVNLLAIGVVLVAPEEIILNSLVFLLESIKGLRIVLLVIGIQVALLIPYGAILIYFTRKEQLSKQILWVFICHAALMIAFWTLLAISRLIIPLVLGILAIVRFNQHLDDDSYFMGKSLAYVVWQVLKFLVKLSLHCALFTLDLMFAAAFSCLIVLFYVLLGDDPFQLMPKPEGDIASETSEDRRELLERDD